MLYYNTFKHSYSLDDDIVNNKNQFVQKGVSGIPDIFSYGYLYGFNGKNDQSYRPITLLTFAIEKSFLSNNSHASHVINVLLFVILIWLLFIVLSKLFREYHILISILISLLYLSHPIHTEVVASIKSRDEILSFIFILSSLNFLSNYLLNNKTTNLLASIFTFFIALLSKESSLPLIIFIPVFAYFFSDKYSISEIKNTISELLKLTSFYLISIAIYMVLRLSILDTVTFDAPMDVINNGLMAANTFGEMLATNFVILAKYFYLNFVPYPLSWDYSFNQIPIVNLTNINAIFSILLYLNIFVYIFIKILKKDFIAFGLVFFLIFLSISSNIFIKIGSTMGERFLFTPSLGLSIFLVFVLAKIFKVNVSRKSNSNFNYLTSSILLAVIIFSTLTINRNKVWKNNFTLFQSGIISSPNSARCQSSFASEYRKLGEMERNQKQRKDYFTTAISYYKKSLSIHPEFSQSHYNMGVTYQYLADYKNALQSYTKAIKYEKENLDALNNIGTIYFNLHKLDSAEIYFKKVLNLNPKNSNALTNIGAILHNNGKYKEALKFYTKSLKINPQNSNTKINVGKIYNILGSNQFSENHLDSASIYFNKALSLNKNDYNALTNISAVLFKRNEIEKSLNYLNKAYNINPRSKNTLRNLIAIHKNLNHKKEVDIFLKQLQELQ